MTHESTAKAGRKTPDLKSGDTKARDWQIPLPDPSDFRMWGQVAVLCFVRSSLEWLLEARHRICGQITKRKMCGLGFALRSGPFVPLCPKAGLLYSYPNPRTHTGTGPEPRFLPNDTARRPTSLMPLWLLLGTFKEDLQT